MEQGADESTDNRFRSFDDGLAQGWKEPDPVTTEQSPFFQLHRVDAVDVSAQPESRPSQPVVALTALLKVVRLGLFQQTVSPPSFRSNFGRKDKQLGGLTTSQGPEMTTSSQYNDG